MLKLVLVDIDGCLTAGEGKPLDFDVLKFISDQNRRARRDEKTFAVTLCTGRAAPYVEALMQAIDAHLPAIYEHGAGMYFPREYRFAEHPLITPAQRAQIANIQRILTRKIIETGLGKFQPGKFACLTLYPRESVTLQQLDAATRAALNGNMNGFFFNGSVSCVEIMPQGIDKGAGVEWLARETKIALAEMGGIGDAPADLAYLTRVKFSAAPANATRDVKARVGSVSQFENGKGVVDILKRWMNL
ncbi:MAG: HAD family phosphatase [Chloroflexi bacterium]|nr:HAD family phosphatase [Chloroflexota bacterium]